jgi:segregation and condensation protein B
MNNNETKMGDVRVKAIIESLLFVNERPIELNELIQITEAGKKDIELAIEELISEYATRNSGICIVKIAGGYQMCSCPDNETWVKKMYQERSKQKLSMAALETLAIAAYKQPITRIEIEAIRGVNVDGVVRKLDELGLIKIGGRKDVVGKPFLYITTRKFLEYFGINSLKDLPKLEDFAALIGKEGLDKPVQDSSSAVDEAAGGCIEGSTENKGEPS